MHLTTKAKGKRQKAKGKRQVFCLSSFVFCLGALLLAGLPNISHAQLCSPESKPLVVLLNGTTRLSLTSHKPIKTITNPKEGLLTIRTVERDPTVVILVGNSPGITRLELEDADGNKEYREVVVQADVEYLTAQLRRAIPLSGISVIPNGINAVILTGYVHRAEDIPVAQAVAQSVGFQVINGLRLNGVQQVQLDVVVARVNRTKSRDFGLNFLGNAKQTLYGQTVGNIIPANVGTVGVPGSILQPAQFGQIISTLPGNADVFGGVIGRASGFLAFLQALENQGLAKLMAQPRLVTLSGNPASFLDGGEQAVPVPAGLGQVGVQFEEFGTRLNFLPIVLGNGRIHLEVEPEVSTLSQAAGVVISGATVPGRATQRVHTTVEMESGQTYVIGGLIQHEVNANITAVPFLGQIPFIGAAFSLKTYTEADTELIVMVTPHLVDAQSCDQLTKVLPGQETRTPDDFELFLEGIVEAPRGPRAVFVGSRYIPYFRNGPTANLFPCAGRDDGISTQPLRPTVPVGVSPAGHGPAEAPPEVAPPEVAPPPGPALITEEVRSANQPAPLKMPQAGGSPEGAAKRTNSGTVQVPPPPTIMPGGEARSETSTGQAPPQ
jgi:pilus assembly protein CpaC